MGLMDEAEKIAGAVVAVEGVKKLNPNANILEEGAAAVAGFEGTDVITGALEIFLARKRRANRRANSLSSFASHKSESPPRGGLSMEDNCLVLHSDCGDLDLGSADQTRDLHGRAGGLRIRHILDVDLIHLLHII